MKKHDLNEDALEARRLASVQSKQALARYQSLGEK